jgi:uncharacterized phage protein (TIGR02220 family)
MSRKGKTGLDYFPHDTEFDNELEYIIAIHKEIGYYVYFRLLERLYKFFGYYYPSDKKSLALLANKINVNINTLNVIINDCLSEHLFDKKLHNEYEILTSRGIQKRYFNAINRRNEMQIISEYNLLDNDYIKGLNVNIILLNVDRSTQSKVKYSKGKESIYSDVISYLNEKTKKKYKPETGRTKSFISARINEGFSIEDFKKVIDIKTTEWLNTDMDKFLRPETLFGNKFESYLNQNENNRRSIRDPKIIPAADYDKDRLHPGSDH